MIILPFRGTLQFKNISYALEPVESVSGFMHMIYEEKNDISAIPLLLENDTYSYERSQYKVRKSSESGISGVGRKEVKAKRWSTK